MSTRVTLMLGATAIVVAVVVFAITRSDAGDRSAPPVQPVASEPAPVSPPPTTTSADEPAPVATSGKPPRPTVPFARPTGIKPAAPASATATTPSVDARDPKREDMREALATFAAGDYAAALVASQRVLAVRPDEPSMLKIAIASACATGAAEAANTLAQTAPPALRDDAVLSCARYGITLDLKRPVRTRQAPARPAKS